MVEKACRTCLKLLRLESVPYFQVEDADVQLSPDSNRFKILSVFPEMALNITKKSVICSSCHETIEMFYHFKAKCLRTESMIMRYIHTKPDLEIETIDLKDVALVNNMGYVTYTETNSSHFGINAEKTNSSHKKSKDCLEGVSSRNSKYVDSLKSNQKQEIEKNKQQLIEGSKSTVAIINEGSVSNKQINGYIGDEVVIERVKKNCSSKKIEEISKGVTIEKVETNKNLDKNSPGICNKSTNINKDYSSSDLSQIDEVVVKQEPITEDEYNDDSLYTSSTEFDESITVVKHELINEDEQEMVIQPENIILQVTQKTKELNGEEKVVLSGNNINENGYNTHKLNESLGNQQINGFEVERKTISKKQIKETNDKNKLQNCVREKLNEDEFKNNVTDMQEDTCVFKNLGEKQSLENLINTNQRKSERPLAKYELRKRVFKKTIDNSLHSGEKMKIAELNSNGIHSNIGKGFDLDPNKVFTNNEKEEKLKRKSTEIESKVENFEASVITERQISTFDYSVIKSIPSKSNTLYEKSVKTLMNRDKNSISRTNLKFYEINKKELNSEVSFISIKKKRLEQQDETTDLSIIPISKKINQPINIEEEKKVATEMKSEITERNTGNDDTIERELNEKPKNMENSPGRKINNNKQAFSSDKACLEMNTVEEEMKFHKEENISGIHDEVEIKTESMEIDELKNNNLNDEQISREINEAVNPVSKYETDEGNTSEELSSEITFNESSMELNSSSQTNIEMHKTVGNSEMFIKTVRNEANTYDDKTSNPLDVSEVKADEFKVTSMELATVSNSDGGLKVDVEGDQLDDSGIQDFVSEDLPKDDEQSIKCSVCSKYFVTKSRLKTHMLCHTDERPYKCSFCPKGFNDKSTLKKHQKIHSGVKEYECEICQRQFYCKGNLNKHMSTHSGERPYKCTICNKDFSRNEHLKQHKLIHTGDKNFECDICSKKFARRDSLIIHMMVHTGVRNYICEYCDKRCIDSSTLKKHLRSHTGDKPYECDVCQRRFTQKTHLTIHRRKHTGERPYNCTLCEKSFYSSNYLKIHQRTHTKEQPYECDVCKKKFSTVSNLKMHSKIHTGIRDFECGICSKMFIHKHDLRKHMMVHTREKPFSCHVCGKAFAKRTRTRQHIINMHKEVDISLVVIEHNNTYMKPFVKVEEDCKNIEEQV